MNNIDFNEPAYWISPEGAILPVGAGKHIDFIVDRPQDFDLTEKQVRDAYTATGEKYGTEGTARENLILELLQQGWLRIRYNSRQDNYFINAARLDRRTVDYLFDFAAGIHEHGKHKYATYTLDLPTGVERGNLSDFVSGEAFSSANILYPLIGSSAATLGADRERLQRESGILIGSMSKVPLESVPDDLVPRIYGVTDGWYSDVSEPKEGDKYAHLFQVYDSDFFFCFGVPFERAASENRKFLFKALVVRRGENWYYNNTYSDSDFDMVFKQVSYDVKQTDTEQDIVEMFNLKPGKMQDPLYYIKASVGKDRESLQEEIDVKSIVDKGMDSLLGYT